jgi:hypothetical protein
MNRIFGDAHSSPVRAFKGSSRIKPSSDFNTSLENSYRRCSGTSSVDHPNLLVVIDVHEYRPCGIGATVGPFGSLVGKILTGQYVFP